MKKKIEITLDIPEKYNAEVVVAEFINDLYEVIISTGFYSFKGDYISIKAKAEAVE